MVKNQKKSTARLSMGGVVSKRPRINEAQIRRTMDFKRPAVRPVLTETTVKIKAHVQKNEIKAESIKKKFKINRIRTFIREKFFYILVSVYILSLYLFKLASLPPQQPDVGLAGSDYQYLDDINSSDFLPFKLLLVGLSKIGFDSELQLRLLSVGVLILSLICFYKFLVYITSRRLAVAGVLLFASSTWTLALTRQDSVITIMFGLIPILLYMGRKLIDTDSVGIRALILLLFAQLLFIPGAIWFMLIAAISLVTYYRSEFKSIIVFAVLALITTILAYSYLLLYLSLNFKEEVLRFLGLGFGQIPSLDIIWNNLINLPNQLFFNGVDDYSAWLYNTPIIDWASIVFLIAGLIYIIKTKIRPINKGLMLIFSALALVLMIINGITYVSLFLPLVYLFIALGIAYLLDQWLIIFPNNPLARSVGIVLVGALIILICGYNVERYFIGWPNSDGYHEIFSS